MLELFSGALEADTIISGWYSKYKDENFGAFTTFVGIVRDEDGIDGLSFDIYEPILKQWFNEWQNKAKMKNAYILMAHSFGDVPNHKCSYISGVLSPKRRTALELIDLFVEDFKTRAPIWKYDLKNGQRVYAKDRSSLLPGAGLLK